MGSSTLYLTTLLTALGFMLIGYDNGVMGGIVNEAPFKNTFFPDGKVDDTLIGTIVAIYEIGCCVGSLITAVVGERLGRKRSIILGAVVMLGGAGFQAGVSSSGAMIGARIVSGLGMGFLNSTMPVLQSEVSPKASRGRFVCFQLSLLNLGIMLSYWCGYGFSFRGDLGSTAWRIPVALQAVFIIPILVLVFFAPESPRWLMSHDKQDEALNVIARLHGRSAQDAEVQAQFQEISNAVQFERTLGSGSWGDLLRDDPIKSRRRVLIACGIQFFQQVGGINGLIFFMGNFFALVSDKPALLAGAIFTWFFAASFIPWFIIDSWGRRKLFLSCIFGMASIFAIETGLIWKVQTSTAAAAATTDATAAASYLSAASAAGAAATAFMFVFMGLFTIGFQANVWCYTTEIQPLRLRQKGAAIATACNWITNYAIVQITPIGIANLNWRFYIIFTIINFAFLPPIYFFFPETKGLSLEEIDHMFSGGQASTFEAVKAEVAHMEQQQKKPAVDIDEKSL